MTRLASLLVACVLAGCVTLPADLPPSSLLAEGAALDLGAKWRVPREGKKRDRAAISAQYHLAMEADEYGPPRAHQIFAAHAQREAIVREATQGEGEATQKAAGLRPSQWQALGPSNVGGRVRSLAIDPRNAQRLFAGTASGGLWLSENAGASWRANFDFLPNLSVSTLVFDPANADVMYLGTGEASAGLVGVGAFKSVDAGRTWQYLAATNTDANGDWRFVNRLAIHPGNPQVLLAAVTNVSRTTGAIYRTADGGLTWARVATMKALDVAFDPHDPANVLAGLDDGTLGVSRDAGLTWARTAPLVPSPTGRGRTARIEIAFARSQAGMAYASVDNARGEVWRSADAGATWALASTPGHLGAQGDYDNAIWVDPTDANHVLVGGLDLYQSRDAGQTFAKVSDWRYAPGSPHADHHAIVSVPGFGPGNAIVYSGNDGGVYRAANIHLVSEAPSANGWTNVNNGLAVTQFYSGAGRTAAGGRVVGGTQDNGSLQLAGGGWSPWRGGDGGFVAVDPANDQWIFGEYVYLSLHRSSNGGVSSTYICNGITEGYPSEDGRTYCGEGATQKANFIAPFVLDPNNANRLVAGANSLWVSDNAKAAAPAWRTIKPPSAATDNFISAVTVAEGNGNVTWVGHNNGEVYRSLDALAAVPTWTRVGQATLPARAVQRVMVDRDDPNRAIVAFTGFTANNVWQTRDGGLTWTSLHANLPNAPVFDVKRHPGNAQWLYAATSVGVFTSEDGGQSWSTTNEGPANIRVRELFWKDDQTLVAATYGRGMFQANVPAGGPANYQDLWWAGSQENGWGVSVIQHGERLFVAFYIYDAQGRAQWVVMPAGAWNAGYTAYTGALYVPGGSWFGNYQAAQFVPGAAVGNATIAFTAANTATLTYAINGVSGAKSIRRYVFGPADATPVGSFADLWWAGAAQDGWGVTINQQYRTLFAVWYTYGPDGRTQWYAIPGGTWSAANTYTGTAYRATGSPWAGGAYDVGQLATTPAGSVSFAFADQRTVVMTYDVDGVSQTRTLTRFDF